MSGISRELMVGYYALKKTGPGFMGPFTGESQDFLEPGHICKGDSPWPGMGADDRAENAV